MEMVLRGSPVKCQPFHDCARHFFLSRTIMTFLSQVQSYVFNVKRFTLQIPIYQTLCIRSWRTQTCEYINHAWELKLHFSSEQRWFHDFSLIFSICRLHTSICSCAVIYVQAGHRVSHSSLLWMWFRHRNTCEQCDLPQQLFFSPDIK